MRDKLLKFFQYVQNNMLLVSRWSAIVAIGMAVIVAAMSFSVPYMGLAVKFSLVPVLLAAAAWSLGNSRKVDRKKKLFAIMALWITLGAVAISQIQYNRLLQAIKQQHPEFQRQQK